MPKAVKKNKQESIIYSTAIIVGVSILAKLASFISEAILAAYLGTSYQSDAFYMVSSIKDVVYPMLSVGIWKVFLPVYKRHLALNEGEKAAAIANKVTTLFTVVSIVVTIIICVFSDFVVAIVAPGFSAETKLLCSRLVKISSPMYIFIIAAAVYASMLQCHNKFFASQIREVASHIPVIIFALLFYKLWGVEALAIALILGGLIRLIVELPFVDWGYKYKPNFQFKDPELKIILKRLPSALISEGVNKINTLIDKVMASSLPTGAVSSLNYGSKLTNVFSGLLSAAVSTAMYPKVVEYVTLNKKRELSALLGTIINIFALLMIPVTLGCFLFSIPLVSAVFKRGAFDESSVLLSAGTFSCYCIGLFFTGCNSVFSTIFYGNGDTKTPMYVSLVNLVANVAGNFAFIYLWGVKGLALSTSTSAMIACFMRLILIKRYVTIEYRKLLFTILKIVICTIIACGIPKFLFEFISVNVYLELIFAAVIGIVIYVLLLKICKVTELHEVVSLLKKRIKRH